MISTVAPGMAAPVESVNVPLKLPVVGDCIATACNGAPLIASKNASNEPSPLTKLRKEDIQKLLTPRRSGNCNRSPVPSCKKVTVHLQQKS
jgi:hypothetical protein